MQLPTAGTPIDVGRFPIGRRTVTLTDPSRTFAGLPRAFEIEAWYPADDTAAGVAFTSYEVLPGVSFTSSAAHHEAPVRAGSYPLLVLSHGRTGNRLAYSGLCQALAGRGAIVVAPDHPGDVLTDWLSGRNADDRTNEIDRLADAHLVLATMTGADDASAETPELDELRAAVDHGRIVAMGHSYGAYTAFAAAAGARGVAPHGLVRAVVGLQAYTRNTSDSLLGRVDVPALLIVSEMDTTTPPASDAERPWELLRGEPTWRCDIAFAGHHASSDVPLYAEIVSEIPDVPDMIRQYLGFTASESAAPGSPPWRITLGRIVQILWAFLDVALDMEPAAGLLAAEEIALTDGCTLRRR